MVTPLRFRAVILMPSEVTRSIRLTGGSVRCFVRISLSSTREEDVLIFLYKEAMVSKCGVIGGQGDGWEPLKARGLHNAGKQSIDEEKKTYHPVFWVSMATSMGVRFSAAGGDGQSGWNSQGGEGLSYSARRC